MLKKTSYRDDLLGLWERGDGEFNTMFRSDTAHQASSEDLKGHRNEIQVKVPILMVITSYTEKTPNRQGEWTS